MCKQSLINNDFLCASTAGVSLANVNTNIEAVWKEPPRSCIWNKDYYLRMYMKTN